jgi:hypothetical protein
VSLTYLFVLGLFLCLALIAFCFVFSVFCHALE